jgi:hypothetical protein
VLPKLRPLTFLLSLAYIYLQTKLLFGTAIDVKLIYPLFFTMASFGLGTSIGYVSSYFYLTYQGFTKKELRSIEIENETKVKCVDPCRGLINMYRFYIKNSSESRGY